MTTPSTAVHYRRPGWATRNLLNRPVLVLTRHGVSVWGSRILEVRGRTSGELRRTPVNLLDVDGRRYLVSPRGNGQWVRNARADGGRLSLVVGRRRERFVATELADADKAPILRAYLGKWKFEVGAFFDGVGPDAPDAEVARIAPDHPVFVLSEPTA